MDREQKILLTGGTGYVGGRMLRALENKGLRVRCLARKPEMLRGRIARTTELVRGDCLDLASLKLAMSGVQTAYYLAHSIGSPGCFEEQDRRAARNFAKAAEEAGLRRIIYLGGLGEDSLSPHLQSRREVGGLLGSSGVEVIEFRTSVVIGSGSLSFETLRASVERWPVMICPGWVSMVAQPIGMEDLIDCLVAARDLPNGGSRVIEIGGPHRVSYRDIMREYARQRGLHRVMLSIPVLIPRLSSLWLDFITPGYACIGRKFIDSIQNATVAKDRVALSLFPIRSKGLSEMISRAMQTEDNDFAMTRWSDALSSTGSERAWGAVRFGNRIVYSRAVAVSVPAEVAFRPIRRIGGATGWYYGNWLWRLRGFLDLLVGGVGLRRGRPDADSLRVGDALDFWRVEAIEENRKLRLYAEMKLPGRGWLEFEVEPQTSTSLIRQTAIFDPVGLAGLLYWHALYPIHRLMFKKMLERIAAACEREKDTHR